MHPECFIPIEAPTSKSHQGQWHRHTKSPNVRVQSLPSTCCHELRPWQTGGVHVRILKRPQFDSLKANFGLKARQSLVDQFAAIKQIDQRAYMQARMSKASDGALEAALL